MNILEFIINLTTRGDKSVIKSMDTLQRKTYAADAAVLKLTRSVSGGLKSAFDYLPGAQFFKNPLVLMTAGTAAVAKMGMEAEKTAASFNLLAGSEEKGSKTLAQLNKYADDTIWNRKTIQDAANAMLNYQIPIENVTEDLKRLGDVAAGDSNKLSTLATVFGQINSLGKLQTQDWKQLINVGYNPLIEISKMTGKSMDQLQKAMEKGQISIKMVRAALYNATGEGGRYYDMTQKLAETSAGAYERMKGSVSRSLLEMYEIMQPVLVPMFNSIATVFDSVIVPAVNGLTAVTSALFKVMEAGAPIVAGLTAAFAGYSAVALFHTTVLKGWSIAEMLLYTKLLLVEKAQKLVNLAMSLNPVGLIVAGIAALVAVVAVCWKKFAGFRAVILTTWDTIKGFAGILKDLLISRLESLVKGLGKVGEVFAKLFKGDFSGAWESAKEAGGLFANIEGKRNAAVATKDLFKGVKSNYQANLENARNAISNPKGAAGTDGSSPNTAGIKTQDWKAMANDITTGGTRNTSITLNISKFWEDVNVYPAEDVDMSTLTKKVLEAVNRSLEAATSAAR